MDLALVENGRVVEILDTNVTREQVTGAFEHYYQLLRQEKQQQVTLSGVKLEQFMMKVITAHINETEYRKTLSGRVDNLFNKKRKTWWNDFKTFVINGSKQLLSKFKKKKK